MSANDEERTRQFEMRARHVLDESVSRVNGRVRSQLMQARQAAMAELHASSSSPGGGFRFWRMPMFMPATGAFMAAALVGLLLFMQQGRERGLPPIEGAGAAYEDLELLSDNDGLELIENYDGSFYEWAAAQAELGDNGASG